MGENTNALVAQYLSGLGADLMKYGGNTSEGLQFSNLNKVTNENIKSNSMSKLIESALGSDGSKMTIDNKGVTLRATNDSSLFKQMLEGSDINHSNLSLDSPSSESNAPTASTPVDSTPAAQPTQPAIPNPFNLPSITPIDMKSIQTAGLTPQEIASVIGMKQNQDQLRQQSFRDLYDSIYKTALTRQANAAADENTPSVDITVGDRNMKVTPKDAIAWEKLKKENLPNDAKVFEYAKKNPEFIGFLDRIKPTEKESFLRAVMADPKLKDVALEMAKAGATNISLGEAMTRRKALGGVDSQLEVMKPDYSRNIINKTVGVKGWEYDNMSAIDDIVKKHPDLSQDQATQALKMATVRSTMDREIKQAFSGQEVQYAKDGWYVDGKLIVRDPYAK